MALNFLPLLSYVLISTFSPGPSNITSASLGVQQGYRRSLQFLGGLAAGVFVIMLLSGGITATLLGLFPMLEPVLRYAGAAYILYLALRHSQSQLRLQRAERGGPPALRMGCCSRF